MSEGCKGNAVVNSLINPIVGIWQWWFIPRSTDPTVVYRERALRVLLPIVTILRAFAVINNYSGAPELPNPYFSIWVSLAVYIIPLFFTYLFIIRGNINLAGACFILHWYITDMVNLPTDGYWLPGFQISLIMQGVLGTLFLPSRAIFPFLIFQLTTIGIWGGWLNENYYSSPLLSTGEPVAIYQRAIAILAVQEAIIVSIVRYLRMEMEKALRLQQVNIKQLEAEIEERHQAETALRQLDDMYRRAIGAAGAVPYVLSHSSRYAFTFAFIGEGILSITGYSASEMTSDLWNSLILDAFPRGRLSHLTFEEADRITSKDHSILWECDFHIRTRDGQMRWIADTSVKGFDEQGEGLMSIGIYQDITERKSTEEKIRQSANQLAMLNEIGRATAALTDLDSVMEIIFQQVEQVIPLDTFTVTLYDSITNRVSYPLIYDYGRRWDEPDSELIPGTNTSRVIQTGDSILSLLSADEFERGDQNPISLLGDASKDTASLMFVPITIKGRMLGVISVQSYSLNAYTADNLKLLESVANHVAIAIENARLFTSVQRELAERKQAEAEIHTLNEKLQQEIAELERFTYTVSHDLKSPLVTIKGFLGLLKRDLEANRQTNVQKDFTRIAEAADKMGILLSELLELSRIGRIAIPPEEVDLVKLTQDALETLDGHIRERNVTVTVSPNLPIVYADRNRLREVLENLIDNAAKYMGDQATPLVEIGKRDNGTEIILYIKDNGIGIEPQFHTKIFGLFEKLSAGSEGSGIGLALIKRIIEVHGGRIWVESEGRGKGSTFCFTIPDKRGE